MIQQPNIPTKEELNPPVQEKKLGLGWRILKFIVFTGAPFILKNQKHIKGTDNEKTIDDIFKGLKEL